ncbi:hypothetical protein [Cohnella fermenti]|uniref:Uncharacterized protein n=1 Tax=Cohnella fermenti TaxID=2565925 RepID=A0A4S4BXT1_9BACL|nr:hypothetical protein [Cohnella fermenti]THF79517.1 hypothetical protein E6C55_12075 [Cohnella fermenti]
MAPEASKVPYGYEPPQERTKGTLICYDSFERAEEAELNAELDTAARIAEERSFARLVLYPIHEETMRRMGSSPVEAYYKREKMLLEWQRTRGESWIAVDRWEGKRKKYTPMDQALRHLTETLPAPYFLLLTPDIANAFASFSSFEEWIVKLRLIVTGPPERPHPKLLQFRERWELAEGPRS